MLFCHAGSDYNYPAVDVVYIANRDRCFIIYMRRIVRRFVWHTRWFLRVFSRWLTASNRSFKALVPMARDTRNVLCTTATYNRRQGNGIHSVDADSIVVCFAFIICEFLSSVRLWTTLSLHALACFSIGSSPTRDVSILWKGAQVYYISDVVLHF